MGLLDSELLRMEGQVWRHPTAHKAWVEAEKKKAEEAKKIKEAKKLEVAKEKEKTKMIRKQLKETGRLNDMKEAGQRLEKLRGDVAVLELKARGLTKEKATELADAERKVREAEQRNAVVGAEAATTAAEMLLKKEKELEQKKKDFEATQSMIAAQRRRELLEYKHQLGLPSSPTPFDHHRLRQRQTGAQPRYPRPNRSNTAIYDDPEFWKLSEEDQRLLEGLDWWEQERLGFGPYDGGLGGRGAGLGKGKGKGKGGLMGGGLSALEELEMGEEGDGHEVDEDGRRFGEPLYDPQHLPGFYCFSTTHPPPGLTILRVLGPLEASVLTAMPPPNAELGPEDRKLFRDELALDKAFAKSDLIEEALRNKANCLLGVKIEMVDRRDGTAELVAQGTVAVARPAQQQAHHQHHPSGGGQGGLWSALGDLQGGEAWNGGGGGFGGNDNPFALDGDDWLGGFGGGAGRGGRGGYFGGGGGAGGGFNAWGAGRGGFAGRGRGNGWGGGGGRGGGAGGQDYADYQRMLARERMMKDQALTGGQGPSGYGDGQQQHQFGAPKAGMSQWGPMGPAAPLHQQPTSYAYGGHPHHAATPAAAAQGHPPGSFPISHPQQHTPRPGPIHTKEDRSLSGNAFSMGTPAFSSMHWPAGAPSTSAGNMPAPGVVGGGNGGAGGDEEALKQLSELQKQLEENLKLQEAQGPAPKGAAGGAEKEQQQPTPAASGWFPKLW